jgi:hypothetical protein
MKSLNKFVLTIMMVTAASFSLMAQNRFFADVNERSISTGDAKRVLVPMKYRAVEASVSQLKSFLWSLPNEKNGIDRATAPVISLPMPDGSTSRFKVWESSIQEPGLEAKYPEIKTFLGQGIDDPSAVMRMDFSPYFGFHAQILTVNGDVYIDPYARGNVNYYMSYYTKDNIRSNPFMCGVTEEAPALSKPGSTLAGPCRGTQLYTYRLAVACTGEYAQAVGGTTPAALHAAIVTTVNRVSGVYEKEVAVRLILIANNDQIEFMDPATDPFNGNNNASTLIGESQAQITSLIGSANFDIGHTFSTGGGGLAGLGVVCSTTNKARGITGSPFPVGDAYDIDYVAHEMGHQFGGSHTFNGVTFNCGGGNRSAATAYEVGSGTTIQAYAGICATGSFNDNIQNNSDPFFHTVSFDQISNFIEAGGATCRQVIATGNSLPQITSMDNAGFSIPIGTPFTLSASATDANGDALTYCWEQWDLTPTGGNWNSGANSTTAPLFKSRIPKTSGSRTFPDMAVILANYPTSPSATMGGLKGETLPQVARTMKFRLTVRDNRAGGGGVVTGGDGCQTGFTSMYQIFTVGTAPFAVTVPNGGESYPGGSTQTFTWNVSGTDVAPVNTSNVKITLSTDGGLTYPTVLVASTPNDGTEPVVIPSVVTSTARVRVEAVGNVFFDISNANFTITIPPTGFDFVTPTAASVSCNAATSTTVNLATASNGGFSTPINLTASNLPTGVTASFGTNPVTPGGTTVITINGVNTLSAGNYTFVVTGVAGSQTKNVNVSFTVQSGTGPSFSLQPTSQSVCAQSNVTFTAAASGATSYQWQVSTNGGASYVDFAGATSTTFTLNNVSTTQDGYRYRIVAISQCGNTISNAAILNVQAATSISNNPVSQTLCVGSNATFTVTGAGSALTYQWQSSPDGVSYTNIAGATSASYTANNITTALNNTRYRVIVSGTCPPAATSSAATLTVIAPVTVTNNPANVTICETGNLSLSVAGTSTQAIIYQWQVSTNGGTSFTNVVDNSTYSGAATNTLNITNVAANMNAYRYRALLSSSTCTSGTPSVPAVLTVNARPTVTLASTSTSILPGQTATITASILPSATGFNIEWYRNGVVIPGATGTTYTVDVTKLGDYKVRIVNTTTGCNNESAVLTIGAQASTRFFIYPVPNAGQFTVSYFNGNGNSTNWKLTVHGANGATIYQSTRTVAGPYTLMNVNLNSAASGVYLVILSDADGKKIATGKILVQH